MRKLSVITLLMALIIGGCQKPQTKADLVLLNSKVYTLNPEAGEAEAIAVKDGVILFVGSNDQVRDLVGDSTEVLDMSESYIYPGFIEGHAHIMGIGANIINVDLMQARSYEEVVRMVQERAAVTPAGEWIIGRGWHQDKWDEVPELMFNGFPTHHPLSEAVPDHPVLLSHASGHASLANAAAMNLAGVNKSTPDPEGGEIFRDVSGQPTGIFNEMAEKLIVEKLPLKSAEYKSDLLERAIQECLSNGLTGFHQAGSDQADVALFEQFASENQLKLRLHVMLSGADTTLLKTYFASGPRSGLYDQHLNIRSVKLYADGALGSRGAWLLEEYSDARGVHGHNVTPMDQIEDVVMRAAASGFQVCTHAIGDRGNREVLNIYEKALERYPEIAQDHRFRIEHAQHIHPDDIPRFARLGVIPAMQAIHMSSDRPWAIDRLGRERIENGAYMWSELIDNGSVIVNGTDAPVEPVSPLASFYASVSRKTLKGTPEGGYEPAQKMTREEALKSYTLWPAYGAFMEQSVGSVEVGKLADFTILDRDIMTIPEDEILKTKVKMTIIGGEVLYADR